MKSINEFEESEAKFIAEYMLDKLSLQYKENGNVKKTDKWNSVIKDIESLETTWAYTPKIKDKVYGQKQSGESIGLWSVPSLTANILGQVVNLTKAKNVLEIGTSAGYSTLYMASGLNKDSHIYTIESMPEKIILAKDYFKKSGLDKKITLLEGNASDILNNWDKGQIDFVFLDADKENYSHYLDQLLPYMPINGLIIADNINDYGHMMGDFLQRVSGTHLPESRCDKRVVSVYVAQVDNGLMAIKKIGGNYNGQKN